MTNEDQAATAERPDSDPQTPVTESVESPNEGAHTATAEQQTAEDQDASPQADAVSAETAPPEQPSSDQTEPATSASEAAPSAEAEEGASEATDAATPDTSDTSGTSGTPATADPQAPADEPELTLEEVAKQKPELAPVVAAKQEGKSIQGKVIGWNKGGFHVSLDGVPAFCPKSQMEIGNPKRAHAYLDRDLDFTVSEVRDNGKRVVVHRKALLKQQRDETIQRLRDQVKSGEPISGKVTSVTDFGAFVDVGGVEGLVHLSQLSRQRVESPSDAVQVGQEVDVKVLKIEKGGDRISLSMKALEPDPWKTADERFAIGEEFTGRIVRATDFGAFVDVGDGIEGLLHTSQLEIGKKLEDYPEGSEIKGWIRDVDAERRRLSLSLREVAKGNPWADLTSRYQEGQEVRGQIEQVAKFGVFILLEPGVSGLLPFSATKTNPGMRPQRLYTPGDTIEVQIASIDRGRKRISLAPPGSKLEGTKADLQEYQEKAEPGGLNAMAAAFAKLQERS